MLRVGVERRRHGRFLEDLISGQGEVIVCEVQTLEGRQDHIFIKEPWGSIRTSRNHIQVPIH